MPEQQVPLTAPSALPSARRIVKHVVWTIVAIVGVLFVALNVILPMSLRSKGARTAVPPTNLPAGLPAPTAADGADVQKGFQHLVAYTVSGYRPAAFTVQHGDTVRFTNTTEALIQIVLGSTTSPKIEKGQYWEQTVGDSGTVRYATGAHTGVITVE